MSCYFFIFKWDILSLFWFLNMIWINSVIFELNSLHREALSLQYVFYFPVDHLWKNIVEEIKFIFTSKAWGHTDRTQVLNV